MKTCLRALLLVVVLTGMASANVITVQPQHDAPSFLGYVPDRFVVVMKEEIPEGKAQNSVDAASVGVASLDALADRFSVAAVERQFKGAEKKAGARELARHYKITITEGTLDQAMAAYRQDPNVERVEPIGIHSMHAIPNDGFFDPYQWYHTQTSDHDIDSPEAWDIETGSDATVVAILDSGTRYYHQDLGGVNASPSNPGAARGNMWINTTELNGSTGVDDDGNGYVDDWIGYDFVESTTSCWNGEDCGTADNDPRDFNGHGTHTSGIVGMLTNDGYGMAGVAGGWGNGSQQEYGNGVKVMPLRMGYSYNYLGQEYGVVLMDAAAEAFYYAADNGADIASCSWGSSNSGGISSAVDYFLASGGLVFVAAGNGGAEEAPDYLNGRGDCISVAATDEQDNGASFTTYGTWVDICAPGDNIYSTYHDHTDPTVDYWASLGGTSMATPMTAGVAALIWSQNPTWSASQVETQLYNSTENIDAYLSSQYIGKMGVGRINSYNAVFGGCDLTAAFTGTPTSGCAPLAVNFTDQSTGTGIDGWSWNFGDGGTSTAQNPSYTYNSAGTYTVALTVSSSTQGCNATETKTAYVTVNGGPTANFVGNPTSGIEPLTVDFTDQSTDATGWSWDFGDGVGTSTQQNPSYTYNTAGTYTVTLTATNACGSDIETKVDYITVDPCVAPVADFSGSPTSGDAPLLVNFTDLSTNAASWDWDFGDGGTSTAQNPSYTYSSAGTYTVTLTVTNSCGSDIATKTDYITVNEPPPANKAYAVSDVPVFGTVAGDYTYTHASDDSREVITEVLSTNHPRKTTSQLEHKWEIVLSSNTSATFYLEAFRSNNTDADDFTFAYSTDDATYNNLVTVASATEQVYSVALPTGLSGTIYIRVTDTDRSWDRNSLDAISVDEMYIEYSSDPAPPVANFSGDPTSGIVPFTVAFTDLSTGDPTSWSWDFGDGNTSTLQHPSHEYTATGTYTVSLTVTNAYGSDTETKLDYITVNDAGASMYVFDMVVTRKTAGPNASGQCTITIYNNSGQPVSGATVDAFAEGPVGGTFSGVTGTDGTVFFETGKTKNASGEWCFEVTNVTHGSYIYDPASNNVTRSCESGDVYANGPAELLTNTTAELNTLSSYPNPFNAGTNIRFSLAEGGHVDLTVYNVLGQAVRHLVSGYMPEGMHEVYFDAKDDRGAALGSGMYFYRFESAASTTTRKMLLLK